MNMNNFNRPDIDNNNNKTGSAHTRLSQLILDSNPLAVTVLDDKMNFIDCNGAALQLFEISDSRELLNNFFLFSEPIQPNGMFAGNLAREYVRQALETGEFTAQWMHKTKSGAPIPCELILKRIDYDDTYIIITYVRDLRAEVEAQAAVREVTERNKLMIDATPIGFVFFDDEFNVVDCNQAALSLFGVANIQSFIDLFFKLSPEYQNDGILSSDGYKTNMQKAFNDGRLIFEWDHLTASGENLPVEVTFVRVEYNRSYRIAGYFRDLREYRAMLKEMQLAEQKLREAKELAEESTKIKSEFLANMSHEIRTPMNGILGITGLAMKNEKSEEQKEYLTKIDQSARSLLRILNDILDFSKIEAGKLAIEKTEFRIDSVLNEIHNILAFSISQKGIELIINISDKINFNIVGDSLRLQQVILNITSNAIKFTHEGYVTVSVEVIETHENIAELLFAIKDTGIGMTKEQCSKVFGAFDQADSSTTRKYGGTGLGLAISKSLIELMDGHIWVESEPNVGTTFFFTAKFEFKEARGQRELSDIDEDYQGGDVYVIPEELSGARLLIVEDNEINQLIASEYLKEAGFTYDIANNGVEAVKMIELNDYRLILMDIQMPEMDGLTATSIIRANSKFENIPIIAMTANAMQGDRERSLSAGMDDHITKPFIPKLMLDTICYWLSNSRLK